jgi:hypothetical protein
MVNSELLKDKAGRFVVFRPAQFTLHYSQFTVGTSPARAVSTNALKIKRLEKQ